MTCTLVSAQAQHIFFLGTSSFAGAGFLNQPIEKSSDKYGTQVGRHTVTV